MSLENAALIYKGNIITGGGSGPTVLTYQQWLALTPQQQENGEYIVQDYPGETNLDYPDYAKVEKDIVANTINGYIATLDDPIIIGFNTDQHIDATSSASNFTAIRNDVSYGLRTLRDLTKELPFDFVVLGGDTHGGSTNTIQSMQNSAIYVKNQMDGIECPLVQLVGNHEGGQDNQEITRGQVYRSHVTKTMQDKVIIPVDYTSGYYDDPVRKVRYIFLDSFARTQANYLATDINRVLSSMLSTIPSGYKTIIFSHHPLDENLPQVAERKGWNNPIACHVTLQSFKDKIIACFCGHVHNNLVVQDQDGITFISTTCSGQYELNDGSTRVKGTVDATAYDVFVIDQATKKIYAVRYGNGESREISYVHDTPTPTRGNILNGITWQDGYRINSSGSIVEQSGYSTTDVIDNVKSGDTLYFADGTLPVSQTSYSLYADDGTLIGTKNGISNETYGTTYDNSKLYMKFINSSGSMVTSGAQFWYRVLQSKNPENQYHSTMTPHTFGETTFWDSGYVKSVKLNWDNNETFANLAKIQFTFPTAKKGSLDIRVNEPIDPPTPTPTILLDIEHATSVEAYVNNKGTVTTNGNNIACSITNGGGGFKAHKTWDSTIHTFASGDKYIWKCDSYTCDLSGRNLPGYAQVIWYDSNDTQLGLQSAFVDPDTLLDALQAMANGGIERTINSTLAGYWNSAAKVDIIMRGSTNSGTAIDPPATLNITNLRIELVEE